MMNNLRAAVGATILFSSVAVPWSMLNESYPYEGVRITIPSPVTSLEIPVHVSLTRTALCPYSIERRVFDASGNKLFDAIDEYSEPDTLGAVSFGAPIRAGIKPANGPALYEVRLSSKCNALQRIWPQIGGCCPN